MCNQLKAAVASRAAQAKKGAPPGPPAPGGASDSAPAESMTRELNRMRNPRSRGLLKS